MHLQQQFGQVDARQHHLGGLAQPDQAVQLAERVEVIDVQSRPPIRAGHYSRPRVLARFAQSGGGLLPRGIQRHCLSGQVHRCWVGEAQPGQHVLAYRLPPRIGQQLRARVGPAL